MSKLSDIVKELEEKGYIEKAEICKNGETGVPEMHVWFKNNREWEANEVIKKLNSQDIQETEECVVWE